MTTKIQHQEFPISRNMSDTHRSELDSEGSPVKVAMCKRSTMSSENTLSKPERNPSYSYFVDMSEQEVSS